MATEKRELPEREQQICARLREFRELTRISRTQFALAIGIGSERLASYEAGRVPLQYEVFRLLNQKFKLNPCWLATKEGVPATDAAVIDDAAFRDKLRRKALFTEAYDQFLEPWLQEKAARDVEGAGDLVQSAQELMERAKSWDRKELAPAQRKFLQVLAEHKQRVLRFHRRAVVFQKWVQDSVQARQQKVGKKSG